MLLVHELAGGLADIKLEADGLACRCEPKVADCNQEIGLTVICK